jgi:hypothetical protein
MDKELVPFVFFGMIVLFILIWKPLHRRFRWWAIIFASFGFALGGFLALIARTPGEIFAVVFLIAGSIAALYEGRQKPIEERRPTVAWMVVNGLWDQLAKEGLPPDEIERLKRLTPEERARLMEQIKRPLGGGQWFHGPHGQLEYAKWGGDPYNDPIYDYLPSNKWQQTSDWMRD